MEVSGLIRRFWTVSRGGMSRGDSEWRCLAVRGDYRGLGQWRVTSRSNINEWAAVGVGGGSDHRVPLF